MSHWCNDIQVQESGKFILNQSEQRQQKSQFLFFQKSFFSNLHFVFIRYFFLPHLSWSQGQEQKLFPLKDLQALG